MVEKPQFKEEGKQVSGGENPPSHTGIFRTLTSEEIEERLQSIADKG